MEKGLVWVVVVCAEGGGRGRPTLLISAVLGLEGRDARGRRGVQRGALHDFEELVARSGPSTKSAARVVLRASRSYAHSYCCYTAPWSATGDCCNLHMTFCAYVRVTIRTCV